LGTLTETGCCCYAAMEARVVVRSRQYRSGLLGEGIGPLADFHAYPERDRYRTVGQEGRRLGLARVWRMT